MSRSRSIIAKPEAVVGIDVGKFSHWAYGIDANGEVTADFPVENREEALDGFFASVAPGTLVVVDQVRNIGALAVSRASIAGLEVAYLPGLAEHNAARLFAGDAKTDARDAEVIARTALGIPEALRPAPRGSELVSAARRLASQRDFVVADSTHDKNRLRAILLESCPEFESLVDLADARQVNLLAKVGGPWQIADADPRVVGALTRGARRADIGALVDSTATSTRPLPAVVEAEGRSVRMLAGRIADNDAEAAELDVAIAELLAGDATFNCLLTVPGIGVRTATELVVSIDVSRFADHGKLASYCGLAPRDSKSGTSISSVTSSRQGNKRLKNLLIFSCNSLVNSNNRFGEYYRMLRDVRHMPHGKALKAVARKCLKAIYAIMRDKIPYTA